MEPLNPGDRVLVADFFADYGQFKKYFTNLSPLSFPIPPPTAIRGMLGAIMGIGRQEAPEYFADTRIALGLASPVRKVTVPINLIKTTSPTHFSRFVARKPTTVEFVRKARYRLYLHLPDSDKHQGLFEKLSRHHSVYTLSFGNSESLANYTFCGEETVRATESGHTELNTIVPSQLVRELKNIENMELFTVTLPLVMNNQRVVERYSEFIYERKGKPLYGNLVHFNRLSSGARCVFI